MGSLSNGRLYRHRGVALLRAAAVPLTDADGGWPDLSDVDGCRAWLGRVWSGTDRVAAIRHASLGLADRVETIRDGRTVGGKQVRRATVACVRYLLRASGRHTPFGLFAGVAPVAVGSAARVRWGEAHRADARVDTQWLADVIDRLESCPELQDRLDVVFTNLATVRGGRLEAPNGPNRVSVRHTRAVSAVRDATGSPIRFGVLADKLAEAFPDAGASTARGMLDDLLRQGFLLTCLRAPMTEADPLTHLLGRLRDLEADTIPAASPVLRELDGIQHDLRRHNHGRATRAEQAAARTEIASRMRAVSQAGRTPLAVDLRLDCDVQVPSHVLGEMERAASALARLTRQPTGEAPWRDYYTAFCDRYGTGTLVPLADVVDPDIGLGLPAGYPDSILPPPSHGSSERDEILLGLAWQAMADGIGEVVLTEETIRSLTVGDPLAERRFPPHVELAARIYAPSIEALQRGEYTLVVAPGRSAGTFTSRFTSVAEGSGLEEVYAGVPVGVEGALPVQLSFPPVHPHAQNVCRVPPYLPHVLPLGEHRGHDDETTTIPVDDLAVTATREGLHLVSVSRQRVVEPQVFHALALDKQAPPLARFLAHLPRAHGVAWHEFDWGPPARRLPYLPRVRYGRAVLSPALWRLTVDDLPIGRASEHDWMRALDRWRRRWRCPHVVELRDADRSLRLTSGEPVHAAMVRAHLARYGHATLLDTPAGPAELGWIGGHVHDIAVPLVTTRPGSPVAVPRARPVTTNREHGQLPGSPDTSWLYAKIHTHPHRQDEIIADHLPVLLDTLDEEPSYWFVRYRSPQETDHLRLRLRTGGPERQGHHVAAVGAWAQHLRRVGLAGRLTLDTYYPETGRYGHGPAMTAAEDVFAADSAVVSAQLRHLPATVIDPAVLAAVNMIGTVHGFLGSLADATQWLAARPIPTVTVDRTAAGQVVRLARGSMLRDLPGWDGEVADAWRDRAAALVAYRRHLPAAMDADSVLEAMLHMHHNRALGIDRDGEHACRRMARQAALAWTARPAGHGR